MFHVSLINWPSMSNSVSANSDDERIWTIQKWILWRILSANFIHRGANHDWCMMAKICPGNWFCRERASSRADIGAAGIYIWSWCSDGIESDDIKK